MFTWLGEELNLDKILRKLLAGTQIASDVEEAIFATVLNRSFEPQSKLGVSTWVTRVYRPQFEQLELHPFCHALDFYAGHKDEIEVQMF